MSKTVLSVDDSKTMRDMIAFTLKSKGYTVLEAEDGAQGLSVAQENSVDLVVTDLNMPNMNGFEMIRALRADPKYSSTPILMLTTEGDVSKKMEGKEAGATGWVVKPFQPEKLTEIVQKVCPL